MHSGRLWLSRVPALIPALLRAGVPTAIGHLQEEETEAAQGGKLLAQAKSLRGARVGGHPRQRVSETSRPAPDFLDEDHSL